jgi:hypothetical protein
MQNTLKWMKWIGAGAILISSMAGCGGKKDEAGAGSDDGVSPAIQSPVMDKQDDKAAAGSDASTPAKTGSLPVPKPVTGKAPTSKKP